MGTLQDGYFLEDIRTVTTRHKGTWFSPDTMRWFNCHLARTCYRSTDDRLFFVSSERYNDPQEERRWTVRVCELDGEINTVGKFQGYDSRNKAHAAAKNRAGAAFRRGVEVALDGLAEELSR